MSDLQRLGAGKTMCTKHAQRFSVSYSIQRANGDPCQSHEARHIHFPGRGVQVHDSASKTTVSDVAELSRHHVKDLVSVDFFTLPTATFRVLFVFIVLRHARRRIVHFNVTDHPSAEWTAQQIVDAFPWDSAPRYLLRDRDQIYGAYFDRRVEGLGVEQVRTAPRSPWQNPFVERVIGTIRRDCLDHVIVLNERHLRRILREYVDYYHSCRTHLSLEKDAPEPRLVESPGMGRVTAIPKVRGLHHYYTRLAA